MGTKNKRYTNKFIVVLIILSLGLIGCGNRDVRVSSATSSSGGAGGSVPGDVRQELGMELIEKQSFIAVYADEMELERGKTQNNYLILKNGYANKETFHIQFDCMLCAIEQGGSTVTIEGNHAEIMSFAVGESSPGKYTHNIIVTDNNNNFYASGSFDVLAR